jgi:hypothetical protein
MFHKLARTLAVLLALGLLTSLGQAQAPATKPATTKSSQLFQEQPGRHQFGQHRGARCVARHERLFAKGH